VSTRVSKIANVIIPVAGQDRALRFCAEASGLQKRADIALRSAAVGAITVGLVSILGRGAFEQSRASGVSEPLFPLPGIQPRSPTSSSHTSGWVERPQHVGGASNVQARPQAFGVRAVHDHPLVA
jgi:hypothetical protein